MMTPKQIERRKNSLLRKVERIQMEFDVLQLECTHVNDVQKYRGNTGNYDPTADCYWIVHTCSDCGKRWITDQ